MKLPPRLAPFTHELILAGLLICFLIAAAIINPPFITLGVQLGLSTHAVELALLALPLTIIIITGGIDLSIGSTMALSSVILGLLFEANVNIWLASLAAILTGTAAGALNGFFIARIRVDPLIVTLATLATYRGLAEGISLGRPFSGFPDSFITIADGVIYHLPIPCLLVAALAAACALAAWRTAPVFFAYAIGDNERAARYAGIPVAHLKFALYTLSGSAAGLAAILYVAHNNTAKADIGTGIELEIITAVVLGGTNIFGGRGTIIGTLLGVALIHELREFVSWQWHRDEIIQIVIGAILIISVLLNNLATRRKS